MGIFCVCVVCRKTVDLSRIKDTSEHMICEKCLDSVPNHVPESQSYYWLKKNKPDKMSSKLSR